MNTKLLLVLSAALVAMVLIGQVAAYAVNPFHFSSDAEVIDGEIVFTVNARSAEFSVLAFNNGDFEPLTELYVFIDARYSSGRSMNQQTEFLKQLRLELSIRNFKGPIEVDADELKDLMTGPGNGKGILMLSGAFPDTVYSGDGSDQVFSWLESKGSIYWLNGKIGHFVSHNDGTQTELEGTDMLFFGMDGAVRTTAEDPIGTKRGSDRAIGEMLYVNTGLRAGDVTNGLNGNIGGKTLSIGFSDENGFGSTTLTDRGSGKGMIVVFGGRLDPDVRITAAQVIASGISYNVNADEIAFNSSRVNGTYHGSISEADRFTDVYIFIGKLHTVYGKHTRIETT